MSYQDFLKSKHVRVRSFGRQHKASDVHAKLFPFQRDLVLWATLKGRAAIFADTGLGKTYLQLEWARLLNERTLIVAPLSVARQTARMANDIDLEVAYVREQSEVDSKLSITNYENIEKFDPSQFGAIVLDESSILKALAGKTKRKLIQMFGETPYRLCCTATPAPNDYIELGNHAEFLGICTQAEMLSMFFINANRQQAVEFNGRVYETKGSNKGGQEWRLKHHAETRFFEWLSSWAIALTKPSDLGYEDQGFELPPLNIQHHVVKSDFKRDSELVFTGLKGIGDRSAIRRLTQNARVAKLSELINGQREQWIIWVGLDSEARLAREAIAGSVEVKGSDSPEFKAKTFEDFQDGKIQVLVTKGKIGGYGLNFQNSHNAAFLGLNDSWELWYQSIRRQWRYGQVHPVNIHAVISDAEVPIYQNVMRKDALARRLRAKLIETVKGYEMAELGQRKAPENVYQEQQAQGEGWNLSLGDSAIWLQSLTADSIDLSVYSPPFADLFTYSDSDHDLGNCRDSAEFFTHYSFIIREILRVTRPGRLTCVHTSDIPAMASRDGYIGVKDFPGDVIRAYEKEGWIFVGRAFVQKNPQAQAIRTKSKALLFVQLRKDSADSRPALVDQILMFRKVGDNAVPIRPVDNGELDNNTWISWAHGLWLDIHESDTLQYNPARDKDDEKHVCPLQLGTIERCVVLYSNPGELVMSPFAGIGSEGYEALRLGRRFTGCELKPSYWKVAVDNLTDADRKANAPTLFSEATA